MTQRTVMTLEAIRYRMSGPTRKGSWRVFIAEDTKLSGRSPQEIRIEYRGNSIRREAVLSRSQGYRAARTSGGRACLRNGDHATAGSSTRCASSGIDVAAVRQAVARRTRAGTIQASIRTSAERFASTLHRSLTPTSKGYSTAISLQHNAWRFRRNPVVDWGIAKQVRIPDDDGSHSRATIGPSSSTSSLPIQARRLVRPAYIPRSGGGNR